VAYTICVSGEHNAGEDNKMELLQVFAQSFTVAGQAPGAAALGKAAFDDPAAGQKHKAGLPFELD
jgi:hypothetical protein